MINYFVFVEGDTDKEFVNNIAIRFLEKKSITLQPIPYQSKKMSLSIKQLKLLIIQKI